MAGSLTTGNLRPLWDMVTGHSGPPPHEIVPTVSMVDNVKLFLAGPRSRPYLYDPEEYVKLYLAGNAPWASTGLYDGAVLNSPNILESYYYLRNPKESSIFMRSRHLFGDFMLDSGAFSFMMGAESGAVDWDEYVDGYASFILKYDIKLFFELDIDTLVGVQETTRLRERLIQATGRLPIWVLQIGRTLADFEAALTEYAYVAFSLAGKNPVSRSRRKMVPEINHLSDLAHTKGVKVHGLGYTGLNLTDFNFDSVDSSAWLYGNRGGFIYIFNGTGLSKVNPPAGHGLHGRLAALHNFSEWIKYQHYLETCK